MAVRLAKALPSRRAGWVWSPFLERPRSTTFTGKGTGLDEQTVRAYMRAQEVEEKRQEQLPLGGL